MIQQSLEDLKNALKDRKVTAKLIKQYSEEVQEEVNAKCLECPNYAIVDYKKVKVHCCNDNFFTNVGYHVITDITLSACNLFKELNKESE